MKKPNYKFQYRNPKQIRNNKFEIQNMKTKMMLFVLAFTLVVPTSAFGASLLFSPSDVSTTLGSKFSVKLLIDTEGEKVNAIEGVINVPDGLKVFDILHGSSLLTFWVERPNFRGGKIYFSGVTPGGFFGPYDLSSGTFRGPGELLTLVIKSEDQGEQIMDIESITVLLNDGSGTQTISRTSNFTYNYSDQEVEFVETKDNTLPDDFTPEIIQDELFDNKYVLIFSTRDGQSGISHFEIKEGKRDWVVAESPYIIKDQILRTSLMVKAIDNAGNVRIVEVVEGEVGKSLLRYGNISIIIIILIFVLLVLWISKRQKRR
jgi:hypothetical protein